MRYARRMDPITGESDKSWEVHILAKRRVDAGERIIQMTIGDHDLGAPAQSVEATVEPLRAGLHHYTYAGGEPNLINAILKHSHANGYPNLADDEVIVLPGAQNALYTACMSLFDTGDVVLVPEPFYATYMPTIKSSGAEPVLVALRPENDFHLDPADLEDGLKRARDKASETGGAVRGLLLNTPHNPTGVVMRADAIEYVSRFVIENDLWLISDEVYQDLVYHGRHVSPWTLPNMRERTVVLHSFSKSFGMTGWRLGWAIGPAALMDHMRELAGCMLFGLAPFIQEAGATVLGQANTIIPMLRDRYGARAEAAAEGLRGINRLRFHRPDAGMFIMIDVSGSGLSPRDFAHRLLAEEDVAILPADGFGPSATGYLRMSLSAPVEDVTEACDRLSRFVDRI